METLTKTFDIPSQGIFGGPKEVTVRPMTTKEEKMLYTAKDGTFLEKIVASCVVEPKDIDIKKLHPSDITFLLYMIREMTFGPTYQQQMQCPYCNLKQDIEIDITEMKNYLLDFDELEKCFNIELPVCKDKLRLKLLSQGDMEDIANIVKRKARRDLKEEDLDGYEYVYRFASLIETINGEERDINEVLDYVDNLNLRDFNEIKKALSSLKIGLDTSNIRVCKNCGEEVEVFGVTVPEFFRSF
ncbi:MAG: hypothetical protein J6T15_05095 [Bacilli bacterium]|nr:hypothetical protein [Bacilli bacterium]